MIHPEKDHPERLFLTTTERDFLQNSEVDEAEDEFHHDTGASLHYLDPEGGLLITYRALHVYHPPQLYTGVVHQNPLDQVSVSLQTGELFHPGELEVLAEYRKEKEADRSTGKTQAKTSSQPAREQEIQQLIDLQQARRLPICVFCGKTTDNYWYLNRLDNTCKCRVCYAGGKY